MDTAYDFITPELFHLLFFKQKNIVVFPYTNMDNLTPLESFLAGYKVEPLDGTALYNLVEILEFSSTNPYLEIPSFYIISSIGKEQLNEIVQLENIHCIINLSEKPSKALSQNKDFVIFNNKTHSFSNYDFTNIDLSFEKSVIQDAKSLQFLLDKVSSLKNIANDLYIEICNSGSAEKFPQIIQDLDPKYHKKLLEFVSNYYRINIPDYESKPTKKIKKKKEETSKVINSKYSEQYERVKEINPRIFTVFKNVLQDYKKNFDDSNLSIDQLFPNKFYVYLMENYWRNGIPENLITDLYNRMIGQSGFTDDDYFDLEHIMAILEIPQEITEKLLSDREKLDKRDVVIRKSNGVTTRKYTVAEGNIFKEIPSVNNADSFGKWIFDKVNKIESLLGIEQSQRDTKSIEKIHETIQKSIKDAEESLNSGRYEEFLRLKYLTIEKFAELIQAKILEIPDVEGSELKISDIFEKIENELGIKVADLKDLTRWRRFRNKVIHENQKIRKEEALEANDFFDGVLSNLRRVLLLNS